LEDFVLLNSAFLLQDDKTCGFLRKIVQKTHAKPSCWFLKIK
jgi:hypothetical protein